MAKTKYTTHQTRAWAYYNFQSLYVALKGKRIGVVGIDPSSTGLGIFSGVVDISGKTKIVGTRRAGSKTQSFFKNSGDIFDAVLTEIDLVFEERPDIILVFHEDVNVNSHITGVKAVGIATGAVLASLHAALTAERKISGDEILIFPTHLSSIKKILTGDHTADKAKIHDCLAADGYEFEDDNQADAYGAYKVGVSLVRTVLNFGGRGLNIEDKKEMLSFYKEIESYDGPNFNSTTVLEKPSLYKTLVGSTQYGKVREKILDL